MRGFSFGYIYRATVLGVVLLNLVTVVTARRRKNFRDPLVIDTFQDPFSNEVGGNHGPEEGMYVEYGPGYVQLNPTDPEQVYRTQLAQDCHDLAPYEDMYLHVVFRGTDRFSLSLLQHNAGCNSDVAPFPETWDSVEASRYAIGQDIYVPLSHFNIDLSWAHAISFDGFFLGGELILYKVEITSHVPDNLYVPEKLPSGILAFKCKRPNSFAFGIDDGQPQYAQEVMQILEEEDIRVTFFTVGTGLLDESANFTEVYREALSRGHQVALHSHTHPRMEGLPTTEAIDHEILMNIQVFRENLGIRSRYFRPPFGVVGARTRQRLAALIPDPYIINWSVDIEDWLWAGSPTPEKQFEAFKRDFEKGGDIAVMHYLSPTTISYFRDVFRLVKDSGKQIMRVDQCMEDPDAPPIGEY
ncbi:hypothetical protein FQN57_005075 [Myotisia sp. PD_48]|nr:hypothetical protein FQN57_005075 [Myotisia sp. PD_48]